MFVALKAQGKAQTQIRRNLKRSCPAPRSEECFNFDSEKKVGHNVEWISSKQPRDDAKRADAQRSQRNRQEKDV
jgi:hypothetical protein